jgi:Trypsin-co-occurring domain 1
MATKKVLVNGIELWVEVEGTPTAASAGLVERGGGPVEAVRDMGQDLQNLLAAVTGPIKQALDANAPDTWSIELSLGFKADGGVPFLAKGEANAAVKLSATWKKGA